MAAFLIDWIAVILNRQMIFLVFIGNFNSTKLYAYQHLAGILWPYLLMI